MSLSIPGIHHITAVTSDAQRNLDFYRGVLGLRLVKLTVNFDDPRSYHLYYGDQAGSPGSLLTFFAWPAARQGRLGPPQAAAVSFAVPFGSLHIWQERLTANGTAVQPRRKFEEDLLSFADPDGMRVELIASLPASDSLIEGHSIRGLHGATLLEQRNSGTVDFLTRTLTFTRAGEDHTLIRCRSTAAVGAVVDVLQTDVGSAVGAVGAGSIHHVAFRAADGSAQQEWREMLSAQDREVTPIIDRKYFRSIYFREPGGVLFEIATDGPGFAVDEPFESLGGALQLPPEYESARKTLEGLLPPLHV